MKQHSTQTKRAIITLCMMVVFISGGEILPGML